MTRTGTAALIHRLTVDNLFYQNDRAALVAILKYFMET